MAGAVALLAVAGVSAAALLIWLYIYLDHLVLRARRRRAAGGAPEDREWADEPAPVRLSLAIAALVLLVGSSVGVWYYYSYVPEQVRIAEEKREEAEREARRREQRRSPVQVYRWQPAPSPVSDEMIPIWCDAVESTAVLLAAWESLGAGGDPFETGMGCSLASGALSARVIEAQSVCRRNGDLEGDCLIAGALGDLSEAFQAAGSCMNAASLPPSIRDTAQVKRESERSLRWTRAALQKLDRAKMLYENSGRTAPWLRE